MGRNSKKGRKVCKIHVKRKGSILVECMALLFVVTIVIGIMSYLSLSRIREENNLWVSEGFRGYNRKYEAKIGEVYKSLIMMENLEEKLKGNFNVRKNLTGIVIAKYEAANRTFNLLGNGGESTGVSFSYEFLSGCNCNVSECEVINKERAIKFIF